MRERGSAAGALARRRALYSRSDMRSFKNDEGDEGEIILEGYDDEILRD